MRFSLLVFLMLALAMSTGSSIRASDSTTRPALLLAANKGDHTLSIIDPASGSQIASVDVGGVTGHEVIASPDGRFAYVPIYGNSGVGLPGTDGAGVAVIDLDAHKLTGKIDFDHGVRPHCPLIGPKDGLLYVTAELDQAVAIIDPRTLKIVGKIPTGASESHMLAISRDGRRGYTANVGPGSVSVLDLENRKTITTIPVAPRIQRIGISVDDHLIFTADQTKPQLAVIDAATNKLRSWVPLPAAGYGAVPTPDGRFLVIPMPSGNQVAVIDVRTMKVAHSIDVPGAPQEAILSPDGNAAYVSCDGSKKIAKIRTADWKVDKLIDAGPVVDGLAWVAAK